MSETVFVTGGSGFVGRALIAALRERGDAVRALVRSPASEKVVAAAGAEPVAGDLDDEAALRAGMEGASLVIHAAAKVELWGPREDFLRITVGGTERVIAAARAAGVPRLVHVSTEAVLAGGRALAGVDETTPLPAKPVGPYPWSKGRAEQRAVAANDDTLTTVVVRPRLIWGRDDTVLLPGLVAAMKSGAWFWFGGGRHPTSTCHVRNVCAGTLLAAERGRGGEIYFLTDGAPVEFRDFVTRMVRTQGVEPPARTAPLWLGDALARVSEWLWAEFPISGGPPLTRTAMNLFFREVTIRSDKAARELGYAPPVSIEQGLAELAAA
ncbi:MAG: NAD-dependent epimerase/dehydratase family protein [Myxococcota bacterium]